MMQPRSSLVAEEWSKQGLRGAKKEEKKNQFSYFNFIGKSFMALRTHTETNSIKTLSVRLRWEKKNYQ